MKQALFLAAPYAVFFALLGAVELGVRATRPHLTSLEAFVSAPQRAQFTDARQVGIFDGDPLLLWRLKRNLRGVVWEHTPVTTSAQGLRYDRTLGPRSPGSFRVLCAGDSVTFGFGVPQVLLRQGEEYHPDWLPYPARLEKALRFANPDRVVEVAPFAVPGYSTHQGLAWMRRDLAGLRPDVVTLLFGWNDIGMRAQPDADAIHADAWSVAMRLLLSKSQALLHAWRWVHSRPGGARGSVPRVSVEGFVANHLAMIEVARAAGARVAVIGPLYRDRVEYPPEGDLMAERRAALSEAMKRAGVPYLEVPELTECAWPGNEPLFLEHIHPNHKGHRLLAERLLPFLAGHRMLLDLQAPQAQP
jgi:lysophospholipase L1-like esterase